MNKVIRIALGSGVLAAGLAFAGPATAGAQVRFEGSFPLPHGRISIGVGEPVFSVGAYVPPGYAVYDDPVNGWGFYAGDEWVPCEQSGTRWIVVERPVRFGYRDYGSVRSFRSIGRDYRQEGRRDFDARNGRVRDDDRRSFDGGRNARRDDRRSGRESRRDNRSWNR